MWVRQHWSEFSTILYADDNIDSPVWVTKNGGLLILAMLAKSHEHTHSGNQIYVHAGYHTLVGNWIVDHSDVVGAPPVGAAPTTSSFST